ncbi:MULTISPECIES: hypothetical protein [Methanosarcina]|nr:MULTISPECIES: hypothetical protein [Methanosarcina]
MFDRGLFEKNLTEKLLLNLKSHNGMINQINGCGTTLLKKGLTEKLLDTA